MNDGPELLKELLIIDRPQLAGENRATDRVLHPSEGALDLRGIFRG